MLIRPGTEVHSYDPLPSDMTAVSRSDLFLYIGGESDKWVDTVLDDGDINSLGLINAAEHTHHERGHDHTDEHIWTSPDNAVLILETICESIIKIDAENADIYRKNCNAYIKKIEEFKKQADKIKDITLELKVKAGANRKNIWRSYC